MFSTLRTRFGIPGIISTIALVLAMTGGAFAAKYLITSTKQISPSVLKKLKGATGPAGAAGAQGPAGATGAAGEKGANGANGTNGTNGKDGVNGKDGTNGKSVKVTEADPFDCNELGGVILEEEGVPASAKEVCNGEPGKDGEKGEKGENGKDATFDGSSLKTGVILYGGWSISGPANQEVLETISFPIRVAKPLTGTKVHFESELEFATKCLGNLGAPEPAESEHLCVYQTLQPPKEGTIAPTFEGIFNLSLSAKGGNRQGAVLVFKTGASPGVTSGSWAVKG